MQAESSAAAEVLSRASVQQPAVVGDVGLCAQASRGLRLLGHAMRMWRRLRAMHVHAMQTLRAAPVACCPWCVLWCVLCVFFGVSFGLHMHPRASTHEPKAWRRSRVPLPFQRLRPSSAKPSAGVRGLMPQTGWRGRKAPSLLPGRVGGQRAKTAILSASSVGRRISHRRPAVTQAVTLADTLTATLWSGLPRRLARLP
eukprot:352562-Chlamydomonas_euryale.AAC.2